jgi:hypothetical protein
MPGVSFGAAKVERAHAATRACTRFEGMAFRDSWTACSIIRESLIGRLPRNEGIRHFSKLRLGKPLCRGEL